MVAINTIIVSMGVVLCFMNLYFCYLEICNSLNNNEINMYLFVMDIIMITTFLICFLVILFRGALS